jgi:hypothetical protein
MKKLYNYIKSVVGGVNDEVMNMSFGDFVREINLKHNYVMVR